MALPDSFYIPPTARKTHVCRICQTELYASDYEKHVAACIAENHDRVTARHPLQRLPGFTRPFDPEYAAWVKANGRVR